MYTIACMLINAWFALISRGPCSPFCTFVVSPRYICVSLILILVKQFLGTAAACVWLLLGYNIRYTISV